MDPTRGDKDHVMTGKVESESSGQHRPRQAEGGVIEGSDQTIKISDTRDEDAVMKDTEGGDQYQCDFKKELRSSSVTGGSGSDKEAVTIFPEEVWSLIFAQLTAPKDLWNASKTCQLFHKMLHPSKTTFLFREVLPHLFPHLPRKKILTCRGVCKEWNEVMDNFLEDSPSIRPHDDNTYDARRRTFINPLREKRIGEFSYDFNVGKNESKLQNNHPAFQNLTADGRRNPFIGREATVWYNLDEDEEEEDCFAGLYKLLETSGQHIWYLNVKLYGDDGHAPGETIVTNMEIFLTVDLFRLVPNLRCLRLIGSLAEFLMSAIESLPRAPSLETLEFLDKALERNSEGHHLPTALLGAYCGQLRRLHLQAGNWAMREELFLSQFHWPNLVELHVEEMYLVEFVPFFRDLKMPRLKKLGVINDKWPWIFHSEEDGEDDLAPIDSILDMVFSEGTHWSRISTLLIQGRILSHPEKFEEEERTFLRRLTMHPNSPREVIPPTLKSLELAYSPGTCHSFLRRFPFLENLNLYRPNGMVPPTGNWLRNMRRLPRETRELVEVNKYLLDGHIYKSNIWEVLPRLKVLTFYRDVFTREGFQKYTKIKMGCQTLVAVESSDSDSSGTSPSSSASDSE